MLTKRLMCLCSVAAFIAVMGFNVITFAGDLEPTAPPGSTMKTLDEIPPTWSQKLPAADRFDLVLDGAAVLDKETGLVWEQSPDTTTRLWSSALEHCFQRVVGGRKGWHLPTVEQLASLVDPGNPNGNPDLPVDDPFSNVQSAWYWSSTTVASSTAFAWVVGFHVGLVNHRSKTSSTYVWCVRGGNTHDAY
ncbi:MAG: DUF1566 domain-containing protein [Candidatus Scalindua sp.]|nr:DUF1566 domain-containing protein [Candidatus Scalindua sp.]